MKFAVGYQLLNDDEHGFAEIVGQFREHIAEVYFPWLDIPTARAPLANQRGYIDWRAQQRLERDLSLFKQWGIKLDLLLNANCYGRYAVSQYLANLICSVIDHLSEAVGGIDTVTTSSLAVAHTVKTNFPDIEVRASVNMRIGTVKGMQYVADLFDGFCVQREYNRDFQRLRQLKAWADANNKKLYMLANSGCLNFCSGQVFHDNLVAHETEIDEVARIPDWTPHVCWNHYRDRKNWVTFLQNSWIRPEDIHHYEHYFPVVKLATRMHSRPAMVIQAYVERRFYGNLLDLLEPGYGPLFAPFIIDNSRFPDDWFERTTTCDKNCHECNYCETVLRKVLTRVDELM